MTPELAPSYLTKRIARPLECASGYLTSTSSKEAVRCGGDNRPFAVGGVLGRPRRVLEAGHKRQRRRRADTAASAAVITSTSATSYSGGNRKEGDGTMFALVCAGRLVDAAPAQVSETRFMFDMPDAPSVRHFVVFLTGAQPLPPGYGASVYMHWGEPGGGSGGAAVTAPEVWRYLGYISNDKPSAIFRLAGVGVSARGGDGGDMIDVGDGGVLGANGSTSARVGISVEPLAAIESQQTGLIFQQAGAHGGGGGAGTALIVRPPPLNNALGAFGAQYGVLIAQNILKNLQHYIGSFGGVEATRSVPLQLFNSWYDRVQQRIARDPLSFARPSDNGCGGGGDGVPTVQV